MTSRHDLLHSILIALVVALIGCSGDDAALGRPADVSSAMDPYAMRSDALLPVSIATNDWGPDSEFGMAALAKGTLRVSEGDCPILWTRRADLALIWPQGYGAYISRDGSLSVYAFDGAIVAQPGDRLSLGGGIVDSAAADESLDCVSPSADAVFSIEEDLR